MKSFIREKYGFKDFKKLSVFLLKIKKNDGRLKCFDNVEKNLNKFTKFLLINLVCGRQNNILFTLSLTFSFSLLSLYLSHTHTHTHTYKHTHTYTRTHTHKHIRSQTHTHIYKYTQTHTLIHTHTHTHTHKHIYIYIYIYIYMQHVFIKSFNDFEYLMFHVFETISNH